MLLRRRFMNKEAAQPNNEIWYTSTDGETITPYDINGLNVNIISNTYENGKGIIRCDGEITTMKYRVFSSISKLKTMTIPNSVTTLFGSIWFECPNLESVNLHDNITTISGGYHFWNHPKLKSIHIPNKLTRLPNYFLRNCVLITEIDIPNSIKTIDGPTCIGNTSIAELIIPASVVTIKTNAIAGNAKLKKIHFDGATPPTFGTNVFTGSHKDLKIYVPSASVEAYKAAANFDVYADKIVGY